MTKKETIIKAIKTFNISLLEVVLEDGKAYMDVSKELFIERLSIEFEMLKTRGRRGFTSVFKGVCDACMQGSQGFTFLTENHEYLDLLLVEKNNEIKDLFLCSALVNDVKLIKKEAIYFSFQEDEKMNYKPSSFIRDKELAVAMALNEFQQFENRITNIESIAEWLQGKSVLFDAVEFLWIQYSFVTPFTDLFSSIENIKLLIEESELLVHANTEFKHLDESNEAEVVDWLLRYENNRLLSTSCYEFMENWEDSGLIKFSSFNTDYQNVIIDAKEHIESLIFVAKYRELEELYLTKYQPSQKQYVQYEDYGGLLSENLSILGLYPELLQKNGITSINKLQNN